MIDLYCMSSPNVVKIILMLEEIGAPYRFHPIEVWRKEQFGEAFRALNPNSKVPVIVDADGPDDKPYTVFESGAILTYLAEKSGQLLPAAGRARYDVLQWLTLQLTGLGPMFGQYVHFTRFEPNASDYARSRYTTEAVRLIDVLNERLTHVPYLGGDAYSIADVATYPWIARLEALKLPVEGRDALLRWRDEVARRPAVTRTALRTAEIQQAGDVSRAAATADDLDRMFGRGRYAHQAT